MPLRSRSISNAPVPHPSPPSSPKTKSSVGIATVANVFLKARRVRDTSNHITASSGPAQSHPCITEQSAKSGPFELIETWVCQDAVEPVTLLRATREALLGHAIRWGANTLVDEEWQYTIRCPRRRSQTSPAVYRVQVSYTACIAVSRSPDPHQPVALGNASNVSRCMTILARNPSS